MKTFVYKTVKPTGEIHTGELSAENAQEAEAILSSDFSVVVFTKEVSPLQKVTQWKLFEQKINMKDRIAFMRQLKSLFDAGLPLIESIMTIQAIMGNKRFKRVLAEVIQKMNEGQSFSESLSAYPDLFSESFIAMVKAGEVSGSLSVILEEQCDLLEWEHKLSKSVKGAIRYPILVISITLFALVFVITFVLPKFSGFYNAQGQSLPMVTRILLAINYGLTNFWWQNILAIASVVGLFKWIRSTKKGRRKLDEMALRLPLFGPLYLKYMAARFSKIFAITYDNGVDIIKALTIGHSLFQNSIYQDEIKRIRTELEDGTTLGEAYRASTFFDQLAKQMARIGEKSGELGAMMRKLTNFYTVEINYVTENLFAYIEPFLILFMGIAVLILALGIFMPMWNIMEMVQ